MNINRIFYVRRQKMACRQIKTKAMVKLYNKGSNIFVTNIIQSECYAGKWSGYIMSVTNGKELS